MKLRFPTTSEIFSAYQEKLAGRQLTSNEKNTIAAWIPVINASYEEGQDCGTAGVRSTLRIVDVFMEQCAGDKVITQILEAIRRWITYAWEQGRYGRHEN